MIAGHICAASSPKWLIRYSFAMSGPRPLFRDDVMCTHERLHCSGLRRLDRMRGEKFRRLAFRLISALIELLEIRLYDPSKFGEFYVSSITVE